MALEIARAAAAAERDDNLHVARLLLLLATRSDKENKPMEGLTKLAKLDFLLRYPTNLERALASEGKDRAQARIEPYERTTIESKMIRFKYGPWDHRYRRWAAIMAAKGLAQIYLKGKTVCLQLTDQGRDVANEFGAQPDFEKLANRARVVNKNFGAKSGTWLKTFVYSTFPELVSMKWGEEIAP